MMFGRVTYVFMVCLAYALMLGHNLVPHHHFNEPGFAVHQHSCDHGHHGQHHSGSEQEEDNDVHFFCHPYMPAEAPNGSIVHSPEKIENRLVLFSFQFACLSVPGHLYHESHRGHALFWSKECYSSQHARAIGLRAPPLAHV
jgi:hypothetical protein